MTATQLFLQFLRENCTLGEYLFFREIISHNPGNRYFKTRPLFKNDFVEGYLSRNNRQLRSFISRLFILAPNLVKRRNSNPRWQMLYDRYKDDQDHFWRDWWVSVMNKKGTGVYIMHYRSLWYKFLDERVDWSKSNKKACSCFRKGEDNQFVLKKKNGTDTCLQPSPRRPHLRR